jgi:hypothetical protein
VEAFWRWWPSLEPAVRHLRFTGGEPLLSAEVFRLIDQLIERPRPRLHVSINSNMGFNLSQRELLLAKLSRLQASTKAVSLYASIDTVGRQAEYIRYGLDYPLFRQNIEAVAAHASPGLRIHFMITLSSLALPGLRDLLAYVLELKHKFPQHRIQIDTPHLQAPEHMSISLLPTAFHRYLDEAAAFLGENLLGNEGEPGFLRTEWQRLLRVKTVMKAQALPPARRGLLLKDFFLMFTEYDRRRGTNFLATFPEYGDFWEECRRAAGTGGVSAGSSPAL